MIDHQKLQDSADALRGASTGITPRRARRPGGAIVGSDHARLTPELAEELAGFLDAAADRASGRVGAAIHGDVRDAWWAASLDRVCSLILHGQAQL